MLGMQFIHKINTQLWMVATMEDHRLRSHLPNKPNIWVHQMIHAPYLQNFPHVMIRYYPASAKSDLVFTLSRFPLNLAMRMYVCFRVNGILQVIHLTQSFRWVSKSNQNFEGKAALSCLFPLWVVLPLLSSD